VQGVGWAEYRLVGERHTVRWDGLRSGLRGLLSVTTPLPSSFGSTIPQPSLWPYGGSVSPLTFCPPGKPLLVPQVPALPSLMGPTTSWGPVPESCPDVLGSMAPGSAFLGHQPPFL
jgi:hypothetical protein